MQISGSNSSSSSIMDDDASARQDMISIVISSYSDAGANADGFVQEVGVSLDEIEELVGEMEEEIMKRDSRLASLGIKCEEGSSSASSDIVARIGRRLDLCLAEFSQMRTLLAERKEEISQLGSVLSDKEAQIRAIDQDRSTLLDKVHGLQLQVAPLIIYLSGRFVLYSFSLNVYL